MIGRGLAKNLLIVLLFSFVCVNQAYAEFLLFKVGDKASYTINQTVAFEYESLDETKFSQSDAAIDLDIKILASDQETLSYPFDVEVTLRKIMIFEIQNDGISSTTISYDSDNVKTLENRVLAAYFEKLINHPLVFRVEKDFHIQERPGYLTQIYENFFSPSEMGLFGATPWTFKLLLTQIFHLSGENLEPEKLHPASCYQFVMWEDEALDEQEISFEQTGAYAVNAIDSNEIKASWKGKAKVGIIDDDMEGEVLVSGNVIWNMANPVIQKRDLEVKIEETYNGFLPYHIKMTAKQVWKPTSL